MKLKQKCFTWIFQCCGWFGVKFRKRILFVRLLLRRFVSGVTILKLIHFLCALIFFPCFKPPGENPSRRYTSGKATRLRSSFPNFSTSPSCDNGDAAIIITTSHYDLLFYSKTHWNYSLIYVWFKVEGNILKTKCSRDSSWSN